MLMQTAIERILSFPWRWSRGICWEIMKWCLFSTQMWGTRAGSASRRRVCCCSGWVPALPLPLPTRHRGRDCLQRFKSSSHSPPAPRYDFSMMAVCLFRFASFFVHHSWGESARNRVAERGRWRGWNPGWQQRGVLKDAECAGLFLGSRIPQDLSRGWPSQHWFWGAGETSILLLRSQAGLMEEYQVDQLPSKS